LCICLQRMREEYDVMAACAASPHILDAFCMGTVWMGGSWRPCILMEVRHSQGRGLVVVCDQSVWHHLWHFVRQLWHAHGHCVDGWLLAALHLDRGEAAIGAGGGMLNTSRIQQVGVMMTISNVDRGNVPLRPRMPTGRRVLVASCCHTSLL
jgi:hypothetical protein